MRNRFLLPCLLLAMPFLAGSKCIFVFSSGGSDDKPLDPNDIIVVAAQEGRIAAPPIQGLGYESGSLSGLTTRDGGYSYEAGGTVRFFIGDIPVGEAIPGRAQITLPDLVPGGSADAAAVVNIARLLQSLDAVPGDGRITIPASLHAAARATDPTLYWAVQSLDFANDQDFANAASALVSGLTRDYPFTAVLIDAPAAREWLRSSLPVPSDSAPR